VGCEFSFRGGGSFWAAMGDLVPAGRTWGDRLISSPRVPARAGPLQCEAALHYRLMISRLLLLRNWYIGYVVLVFVIGGHLLWPDPDALMIDALIYIAAFLLGYWLFGRGAISASRPGPRTPLWVLRRVLLMLVFARVGLIVYQIAFVYGLTDYFSGAALVRQLNVYGQLDIGNGWFVILTNILNLSTVAACAYYLRECLAQESAPRFGLVAGLMVGMPLLALQRSSVLFGVAFLSVAYAFIARVRREKVAAKVTAAAVAGILALGVGVFLGLLREDAFTHGAVSNQSFGDRVFNLAEGEMSPIIVYATFEADAGKLVDYQHGQTILSPLLFKLVPRNWYTDKPINSGAFYATQYQPAAFAAGYSMAPSLWGALYLNFGYVGTIVGSFLLGMLTARLDRIYRERRIEELGWYLIVYYSYYSVLRDDVTNAATVLVLTGAVFLVMQWLLTARRDRGRSPQPLYAT